MSWLLGYDMTISALTEFKKARGLSEEYNMWAPVHEEFIKVFGRGPFIAYGQNAVGHLTSIVYFHQTDKPELRLDPDDPTVPTKAEILELRRVFGRREMWYLNWDATRERASPKAAIYGDDGLDEEEKPDQTFQERMKDMAIKEEDEDKDEDEDEDEGTKQSDSNASPSNVSNKQL